jgi:hypothetical protein
VVTLIGAASGAAVARPVLCPYGATARTLPGHEAESGAHGRLVRLPSSEKSRPTRASGPLQGEKPRPLELDDIALHPIDRPTRRPAPWTCCPIAAKPSPMSALEIQPAH